MIKRGFCLVLGASVILCSLASVQARVIVVNPSAPDADDANSGAESQPLKTISRAAEMACAGDVVRIHAGVYREKVTIDASGSKDQPIRFEAAAGAEVIITGADLFGGWEADTNGTCVAPWPYRLFQGDEHNPGGSDQLIIQGVLQTKVAGVTDIVHNSYWIDMANQRMHLCSAVPLRELREMQIEASVRNEIWVVTGSCIQTRGLRFRFAANRAQQAMAQFRGDHAVVEDCVFEWSNSTGAQFRGEEIVVRRCTFQDNGQQGFTANGAHRLRMQGCTVQRNNVKEYPRGWEAGGNKICFTRGAMIEQCRFLGNHGNGIWFDISNVDCTVRNCLIADNEDAGIFYEISYGLHAHDNVIVGNGLAGTKGAWGANGGVCVSSSPGCIVERNLIVGNEQGFCFREQNRTTARVKDADGPQVPEWKNGRMMAEEVAIWNHDEVIRDNIIADNRTAQVQGWFDIATEQHWPRAMQEIGTTAIRSGDGDGTRQPTDGDQQPKHPCLEDLHLHFERNVYAYQQDQPFFVWGTNWKRKVVYGGLEELTNALGFEGSGTRIVPGFDVNTVERDFRLPPQLWETVRHAYPRGVVPDCQLGAR